MSMKKVILGSLVTLMLLFGAVPFTAEAKSSVNPALAFAQNQEQPPTDEITEKYHSNLLQELAIGRAVSYALLKKFDNKINTDPDLNRYVNLVGQSIAKEASNRPQIDYKFGIIDTSEINAFACPGGYVFVTTGLLKTVYDENELAGVLAHEIGHIEHGDGLRDVMNHKSDEYAKAKVDDIERNAAIVGDIATSLPYAGWYASYYSPKNIAKRQINRQISKIGGGYGGYVARSAAYSATDVAVDAAAVGMKKMLKALGQKFIKRQFYDPLTPEIEFKADAFSAEALAKVGYDPKGISSFLETVQYIKSSQGPEDATTAQKGSSGSANMFTYRHPPIAERVKNVDTIVDSGNIDIKNPKAADDKFFEERYTEKLKALK